MKQQLAGIEMIRLVKEVKDRILNGKINQVYVEFDRVNGTKKELLFELYVPNKGKELVRILLPTGLYLSSVKPEMPTKPDGYCLYLRKWLKNARIRNIEQVSAERILKLTVETKDPTKTEFTPITYFIYIELFSKGNFIMTNDQNIILSPLEVQEWSGRVIKPKEVYIYPKQEYNAFKFGEADFGKALEQSEKETLAARFALDFGLGGTYAEELCARAEISPQVKSVTKAEQKKLFVAWQDLLNDVANGTAIVIKENNTITDVFPCPIKKYKGEACSSFLEGLDKCWTQGVQKKALQGEVKKSKGMLDKFNTMIQSQEKQIATFKEDCEKNQKIGEKIYEQYALLENMFNQLKEARKTKSWDEIKKALKGHKIITSINEKNQEIMVNIE